MRVVLMNNSQGQKYAEKKYLFMSLQEKQNRTKLREENKYRKNNAIFFLPKVKLLSVISGQVKTSSHLCYEMLKPKYNKI